MLNIGLDATTQLVSSSVPAKTSSPTVPEIDKAKNVASSDDLEEQISEETKRSVNYQIIDKLLIQGADKESDKDSKEKTPDRTGSTDQVSISDQAQLLSASYSEQGLSVDGQAINASTEMAAGQRTNRLSFSGGQGPVEEVNKSDPIILDMNGDGIKTSGIKNGENFDINADGEIDRTSVASSGDAFLAYDKNGNGMIDNGSELFGDQNGAANGYEELAKYDDNKDGQINKDDAIYEKLSTLSFSNGQQQTSSLKDQGIESINLTYANKTNEKTHEGNDDVAQTSSYTRNGTQYKSADALLAYTKA